MRTVYMVYANSDFNNVIALFFTQAKADAYITAALPLIYEKTVAEIPVPFNRIVLTPVNPL